VDTWFDAVFYVLLAVYWLADLFFEYVKGKGFTVTSSVLTPLFTLCAVKYVLDLVHAQFQSVSAWCFAIFWVLFAGSHLWGLIRKYLKKIGTSSGKQPDPSNA